MATHKSGEARESVSSPTVKPIERETVPVFGVEPPWKLPSALWELWKEHQAKRRESQQPQ